MVNLTDKQKCLVEIYKKARTHGISVHNNDLGAENTIDIFNDCLWYSDDKIEVMLFDENLNPTELDEIENQELYGGAKEMQSALLELIKG